MPRPIAIQNLKSLGFLRSRSAPPTPRENTPVPKPATVVESSDEKESASITTAATTARNSVDVNAAANIPVPNSPPSQKAASPVAVGTPVASITPETRQLGQIVESPGILSSSSSNADETPTYPFPDNVAAVDMNTPSITVSGPEFASPVVAPTPAPSAPPLEAILVERKRRAHMQAIGVNPSTSVSMAEGAPAMLAMGTRIKAGSPVVKGKGFKSSPLTGGASEQLTETVPLRRTKREGSMTASVNETGERTTSPAANVHASNVVSEGGK